jgi:hypothetical protein
MVVFIMWRLIRSAANVEVKTNVKVQALVKVKEEMLKTNEKKKNTSPQRGCRYHRKEKHVDQD